MECFWHFQFSLSRSLIWSQAGSSEGKHHQALKREPETMQCCSFYPAEWQRRAKYLPINLTWCSSGCWLSISNERSQEAEPGWPQDRSDIRLFASFRTALWCRYSTWNLNYEVHFRIVVKCWKHNISTCLCQITNSYYCCCVCQEAKDAKTADGKVQALFLSETCFPFFKLDILISHWRANLHFNVKSDMYQH